MAREKYPRTEKYISYLSAVLKLDDENLGILEKLVRKHKIYDSFALKKRLEIEIDVARHNGPKRINLKNYNSCYCALLEHEKEISEDPDNGQIPSLYCQLR